MFFYIGGRHAPAFYAAISRGLSGKLGRDFNV